MLVITVKQEKKRLIQGYFRFFCGSCCIDWYYLAKDVVVVGVIETSLKDSFNTKYDDDVVVKVKSPSVEEDEQKDHKKTSSTFLWVIICCKTS